VKALSVPIQTVLLASVLLALPVMGGVRSKITGEIIEEVVERAARRSGRKAVDRMATKAANETLERLVKTYGDDVLKVVDDAGFELLESVPKHGDEIVKLATQASPKARRVFAQNIPELLPLVRRVGTEALELEAKSPGLSARVFRVFGDDAGKALARNVPAEDIPRLLRYAEKADSPGTRKALMEAYGKEGKRLFERIPPKLVLALGLSASMLYATHELTEPIRAIGDAIGTNSDVADTAVRQFAAWATVGMLVLAFVLLWRFGLMPWQRPRHPAAKALAQGGAPDCGTGGPGSGNQSGPEVVPKPRTKETEDWG
jgi:hypothetical protein